MAMDMSVFFKALASTMNPEEFGRMMKDTMPSAGRPVTGHLYDGGPFSLINEDIYSLNIANSSELTQWLPTRSVDYKVDEVQHMAWGAVPYGFDGSQTYSDWLSTITIPTCGYGPAGTNWDGFSYRVEGGMFSWTTDMMTVWEDSGLKYFQKQPIYNIRGGNGPINGVITSDKDWALAQLLDVARRHVDFINIYGEKANSDMEWDGLSTIIQPGYVQSRVVGPSASAAMADPIWMNGAGIGSPADPAALLKVINSMVSNRLDYAKSRGWEVSEADCALVMHPLHLEMLQEALAQGGLFYWTNLFGTPGQMTMTVGEYEARLERTKATKSLPLGGRNVRVITEVNLGFASTVTVSAVATAAHTADIFFLVKRLNGRNILENLFIDWSKMDYPFKNTEERAEIQGGIARTGFVTEASKCYYYFLEMAGRMVCTMMPMQGRISNVTMTYHNAFDKYEQTAFWAPSFAAYNGAMGGQGTQLLFGQRE